MYSNFNGDILYGPLLNKTVKLPTIEWSFCKFVDFHRRIQDFFRGGLKNEFIRMCNDCIAVKTQLLS